MQRVGRALFAGSIFTLLGAAVAPAQSIPFDFNLAITLDGNTSIVNTNNDQISLTKPDQVTITATYTGTTQATITGQPTVQGSVAYTAAFVNASPPIVLTPGESFTYKVTYAPTNSNSAPAQVSVPYSEVGASGTFTNAIILVFSATLPNFSLFYAIAPNNNFQSIASGGTIKFSPTPLNTTVNATLDIENTGSGPGGITSITLPPSTSPFQLEDVPPATAATPYILAAGMALAIGVQYIPTAVEKDTAQFTITFQNGTTDTINLAGSGATSTFTYSVVSGTTTTPVTAGGTITLPSVTVPTSATTTPPSSSVIVQVKNTGNASGVINSIIATPDPPFGVSNPQVTPPTLTPGGTESFSVTFTPTTVGTVTGTLIVGNDEFKLSGTGLGPQLSFSYSTAGSTVTIGQTGTVVFPNTQVSQSNTISFTVTNTGTLPTTISSVGTSPPFSVGNISPTTLQGGQSMTLPITFTPTVRGPVNQQLVVNGSPVTLEGVGTAPPPLPSYTISGPSGTVAPASQANVSLTLAGTYPVDLNGVLTLTTSGTFGTDPGVEFSNGLRTVDFVIPAGSTSANFAGQGSQILMQTGTVAETVTLTPSFATTGGVDVTPASPTTLQFTIAPSAPVLETLSITNASGSQTGASFTLVITGYSTTRDLSTLNVTLTAASGFNLTSSQISQDLSGPSSLYFQSAASQAFGGTFQVSVPFTLTGTAPKNETLLQAIASVSASMSNSVGASNTLQANFQ